MICYQLLRGHDHFSEVWRSHFHDDPRTWHYRFRRCHNGTRTLQSPQAQVWRPRFWQDSKAYFGRTRQVLQEKAVLLLVQVWNSVSSPCLKKITGEAAVDLAPKPGNYMGASHIAIDFFPGTIWAPLILWFFGNQWPLTSNCNILITVYRNCAWIHSISDPDPEPNDDIALSWCLPCTGKNVLKFWRFLLASMAYRPLLLSTVVLKHCPAARVFFFLSDWTTSYLLDGYTLWTLAFRLLLPRRHTDLFSNPEQYVDHVTQEV